MATRIMKKGETPAQAVAKIESKIKRERTKLVRATNALAKLEKQRTYYVKKMVEQGM